MLPYPPTLLKVIAHDVRWQLLAALTQSDYRVQELVEIVGQRPNLVSYHLGQIKAAGIVKERRSAADARDVYYSLDLERLDALYSAAGAALHPALSKNFQVSAERTSSRPQKVLFLCTENSARSQMAEGLLRHTGGNRFEAFSAGTVPTKLHPNAIKALSQMGVDISQQQAKSIDQFQDQIFDYVITVCDRARENCPTFPNKAHMIHWSLPDPVIAYTAEAQYRAFEQTARELSVRLRYLLISISSEKGEVQ